jgi:hypothetical protein
MTTIDDGDCFIAHVGALGWAERAGGGPDRGMLLR